MLNLTEVLSTINKARAALDLPPLTELPKAIPGDPCNCVVAECFPHSSVNTSRITNVDMIRPDGAKRLAEAWSTQAHSAFTTELPELLKDFVCQFDEGAFPQLLNLELKREDFAVDGYSVSFRWAHTRSELSGKLYPTEERAKADLNEFFKRAGI